MFDLKKLEAFLDSLEVETHFPSKAPVWPKRGVYAPVANPAIEAKMDKYDIFRNDSYKNLGTPEFPIWGKEDPSARIMAQLSSYYSSVSFWNRSLHGGPWDSLPIKGAEIEETPYEKLQKSIGRLQSAEPAKLTNPAPPDPARHQSPDYVHTITAWRGWSAENGLLEAVGTDFTWEPKVAARARCRQDTHTAPDTRCGCGYWSFKTMRSMIDAMKSYATDIKVVGTVEIWGKVIECEHGFRSEYAYPKELWLLRDGLESLSWTYGVPVRRVQQEPA